MATIAIGVSPKVGGATATVPLNALAEDGVPPEVGDSISASVEGKIQSIDGDTATVSIDSINGEPIGEEGSESSEEEAGEEGGQGTGATPGGGNQPPVQASGPGDLAPMGGGMSGVGPARNRLNRAGTNVMRNKLLAGAKKNSLGLF